MSDENKSKVAATLLKNCVRKRKKLIDRSDNSNNGGYWTKEEDGNGTTMFSYHSGGRAGADGVSNNGDLSASPKAVMRMDHSSSLSSEDDPNSLLPPLPPPPPAQVVVRPDEVAIVVVVLMLWAAAIALFINRWGKIRLMEPYQPYFEPEPPAQAAPEVSGAHRTSVFDPRPSLTILPPSANSPLGNSARRYSNLSTFLPQPIVGGLVPPVKTANRRMSSYVPQRRASYFVPLSSRESSKDSGGGGGCGGSRDSQGNSANNNNKGGGSGSRRSSFLLAPDPTILSGRWSPGRNSPSGGGSLLPHGGRTSLTAPRPPSASSRRTSVCTAAEYLMMRGVSSSPGFGGLPIGLGGTGGGGGRKNSWLAASKMNSNETQYNSRYNSRSSIVSMGNAINRTASMVTQSPSPPEIASPNEEDEDLFLKKQQQHQQQHEVPKLFCTRASPVDKKLEEEDDDDKDSDEEQEERVFSLEDSREEVEEDVMSGKNVSPPNSTQICTVDFEDEEMKERNSRTEKKRKRKRRKKRGAKSEEEEDDDDNENFEANTATVGDDTTATTNEKVDLPCGGDSEEGSGGLAGAQAGLPSHQEEEEEEEEEEELVGVFAEGTTASNRVRKTGVSGAANAVNVVVDYSSAKARRSRFRTRSCSMKQSEV